MAQITSCPAASDCGFTGVNGTSNTALCYPGPIPNCGGGYLSANVFAAGNGCFSTQPYFCTAPIFNPGGDTLFSQHALTAGNALVSVGGQYKAMFDTDGACRRCRAPPSSCVGSSLRLSRAPQAFSRSHLLQLASFSPPSTRPAAALACS